MSFRLGDFELDVSQGRLTHAGAEVPIEPKPLSLLAYLAQRANQVIPTSELQRALWGETSVSSSSLHYCVSKARRALGPSAPLLEMLPRRGYRLKVDRGEDFAGRDAWNAESTPFVGREVEQSLLHEALERAGRGRGGVVLIVGEPGIGKSRLADELSTHARRHGARVFWGRRLQRAQSPAFAPWPELLRDLMGNAGVGARRDELRRWLEPSLDIDASAEGGVRSALFERVAAAIEAAGRERLCVLAIDDLHDAQPPAHALLKSLSPVLAGTKLLIVATAQPERIELEHLASVASVIELHGLSPSDIDRMLRASCRQQLSPEVIDEVARVTGGNPLFVQEVGRLLRSRPDADPNFRGIRLPMSVREAVRQRLLLLSPEERELLDVASTLGASFDVHTLTAVLGKRTTETVEALGALVRVGLLVETSSSRFRFSHAVVQDFLHAALDAPTRVRLHLGAARALEQRGEISTLDGVTSLAHHLRLAAVGNAGVARRAIATTLKAADVATFQGAHEVSAHHYEQVLDLLGALPAADASRLDILIKLGDALRLGGRIDKAQGVLTEAVTVARLSDDARAYSRAVLALGHVFDAAPGLHSELESRLKDALHRLPEGERALRSEVLGRLAIAQIYTVTVEERCDLAEQALRLSSGIDDGRLTTRALLADALARWGVRSDKFGWLDRVQRAYDSAVHGQSPEQQLVSLNLLIPARFERGLLREYREVRDKYQRLALAQNHAFHLHACQVHDVCLAIFEGRLSEAEEGLDRALSYGNEAGVQFALDVHSAQLVGLRREQGRLEEIVSRLDRLSPRQAAHPVWRAAAAMIHMELGEATRAREDFEWLASNDFKVVPEDNLWATTLCLSAEVCHFLGDERRAPTLLALLGPFHEFWAVTGSLLMVPGNVSFALGRLSDTLADASGARRHYARARDQALAMGARLWARRAAEALATA